ncbi:MAG TPA: serine hydrolase domain-containing protein [Candidatus Sulfotelmatobacter sp.]|nr:serine hydrolase domain-containing protein [Candidatus Sulfotelmatobacter sp.]
MRNRADVETSRFASVMTGALGLPPGDARELGLSLRGLTRLGDVFRAQAASGIIPGAIVAIARRGKVGYCETFGFRDRAKGAPMTVDSIFRIASMTKPFTSIAAMMLAEEGKLQLVDAVAKYLPALRGAKVAKSAGDATPVPAEAEMTIHDLLRHTSGLTRGLGAPNAVRALYQKEAVQSREQTLAQQAEKLGRLPLAHQPGTVWDYSVSTDVLARVVEVASGQPFDAFLAERIWQPLGLKETAFHVPEAKWERIAEVPEENMAADAPRPFDVRKPYPMVSGGGGMVASIADYLRFAQMLLNGGELEGTRLVSRKTLALMTSDHLGSIRHGVTPADFLPGPGYGFGLGFAVRTAPGLCPFPGSRGEFYWSGIFGTRFWVDPEEQLIAVMMLQAPNQRREMAGLLRTLVYQALD